MIFVTVGHQRPFDRLVRTVDEWAGESRERKVFAQIGDTKWQPHFIEFVRWLKPDEYRAKVLACNIIVSHAGMGSIITALEFGKPILVMPRRGELGETRNDHQVSTAQRFSEQQIIAQATDEFDLRVKLDTIDEIRTPLTITKEASDTLLATLRSFIRNDLT